MNTQTSDLFEHDIVDLVTASFSPGIDLPTDEDDVGFLNENLTTQFDVFLHFCCAAGTESIADEVARTLPELKPYLNARDSRPLGMVYDTYANNLLQNLKTIGPLVGVSQDKASGNIQVKMPLIRVGSNQIDPFWSRTANFSIAGKAGAPDTNVPASWAYEAAEVRWAGGAPGSFLHTIPFNRALIDDLYSTEGGKSKSPFDQFADRGLYTFLLSSIDRFELRAAYEPPTAWNAESNKYEPAPLAPGFETRQLWSMRDTPTMLYVVVNLPRGIANWMGQNEKPDTRVIYQWFRDYYSTFLTGNSKVTPGPINTLDKVATDLRDLREVQLTNSMNLCTTFQGEVRYVPPLTDMASYNAYVNALNTYKVDNGKTVDFDPYAQAVKSGDVRDTLKAVGPINQPIYTDWRMNRFSYLNTLGGMNTLDLNGAKPATSLTLLMMLNQPVSDTDVMAALSDIPVLVKQMGIDFLDYVKPADFRLLVPDAKRAEYDKMCTGNIKDAFYSLYSTLAGLGFRDWPYNYAELKPVKLISMCKLVLSIAGKRGDLYAEDGGDFDYTSVEGVSQLGAALAWPGLQSIKRAADSIVGAMSAPGAASVSSWWDKLGVERLSKILPYIIALSSTTSEKELYDKSREERSQYVDLKRDPNYVPAPVPNINANVSLLPHQVKADFFTQADPDNLVHAVQAGGGKTFLGLIDAGRAMTKGERTAIICPNYLIKNYLEDGNYMFSGRVNFVAVDNTVYTRYGEDALRALITGAPVNTITLFGLSVFSQGKNITYSYDGQILTINQISEFFRSLGFDRVIIDESHLLANPDSNRSQSVARALSGVPKVREMTGTFINGTVFDSVGQTRLMDPSLLGTDDQFIERYAETATGRKVISWKEDSERKIVDRIKSGTVFNSIRRKEWVALLPERDEEFYFCDLSPAQLKVYRAILEQVMAEIEESDPVLAKKLREGNEEDANGVEALLSRFLARVERFLASPDLDPLGAATLKGSDLQSPKSVEVNKIVAAHFADPDLRNGKIMIFTSYKDSAKSIYEHLDPEWKRQAIHYEAEKKDELLPLMKKDDRFKIVVGVENSLNTGHNFQMFNHLIRIETVWNPGTLDQAESRLNRPDPKNKTAKRAKIKYDWVCCKKTIDVTKTSRLISKLLSATKFEEQDSDFYDDLPSLPIVSMNYDNIMTNNNFEETLWDYLQAYKLYQQSQRADFDYYLKNTVHTAPVPLPSAGLLKGSATVAVPYIPGMVLPYQDELGLENLGDYAMDLKMAIGDLGPGELKGKRIHTEFGDGVVTGASRSTVRVTIGGASNQKISVDKLSAFLIPDQFKGSVSDAIQKRVGLQVVSPGKPQPSRSQQQAEGEAEVKQVLRAQRPQTEAEAEMPAAPAKPSARKPVPNTDTVQNASVEVFLGVVNNNFTVNVDIDDPDMTPELAAKAGFTLVKPYYYALMKNARQLAAVIDKLGHTYSVPAGQLEILEELQEAFTTGRSRLFNVAEADMSQMRAFVLEGRKATAGNKLYVYPFIDSQDLYVCAWASQPAAKKLPQLGVPGVQWKIDGGYYTRYFRSKPQAKSFITGLKDYGITVEDMASVIADYNRFKLLPKA